MRVLLILAVSSLACLASSSPVDQSRKLVNLQTKEAMFRETRSAQVKGHNVFYVKGVAGSAPRAPELEVRKGEYICGNKVCRLQPGEIPKGCEGHICQYPIDPSKDLRPGQPRS